MAENDNIGSVEVADPFAEVVEDVVDDAAEVDDNEGQDDSFEDNLEDEVDPSEEKATEEEIEDDEDSKKLNLFQELKKSSPEVLKAHPELREILVRENKYSDIFDSPEQAANVAVRAQGLIDLEAKILSGDSKVLLTSLERVNKDQFLDFAHNFLPTLAEVDQATFTDILRGPIKRVFRSAMAAGSNSKNDNLKNAALVLNEYFFEGEDITKEASGREKKEESPEIKAARDRESQAEQRLHNNFRSDVAEVYGSKLKSEISQSFAALNESEFTKRALVKETEAELDKLLREDKRHQANMSALWRQAQASGYTREFKSKIYSAALSKAKALLPVAKRNALGQAKRTVSSGKPVVKQVMGKKKFVGDGSNATNNNGPRKIDWSKTSERDILAGKAPVYKK